MLESSFTNYDGPPWPRWPFKHCGAKLSVSDLDETEFLVPNQLASLLLWRNGGRPARLYYPDKQLFVRNFMTVGGLHSIENSIEDYRDDLPEHSVPFAEVEDMDTSFLIVFNSSEKRRKLHNTVWLLQTFHESTREERNSSRDLVMVSDSIHDLILGLEKKNSGPPGWDPLS